MLVSQLYMENDNPEEDVKHEEVIVLDKVYKKPAFEVLRPSNTFISIEKVVRCSYRHLTTAETIQPTPRGRSMYSVRFGTLTLIQDSEFVPDYGLASILRKQHLQMRYTR